jgi:hypothetical protein
MEIVFQAKNRISEIAALGKSLGRDAGICVDTPASSGQAFGTADQLALIFCRWRRMIGVSPCDSVDMRLGFRPCLPPGRAHPTTRRGGLGAADRRLGGRDADGG